MRTVRAAHVGGGVSIRAPVRGRRPDACRLRAIFDQFQSAPPVKGRPARVGRLLDTRRRSNPRPREGATSSLPRPEPPVGGFNPRPREGVTCPGRSSAGYRTRTRTSCTERWRRSTGRRDGKRKEDETTRYVSFIHWEETDYGVSFPNFPGCVCVGETVDDAVRHGGLASAFHVEGFAEDGEAISAPRTIRNAVNACRPARNTLFSVTWEYGCVPAMLA